MAAIALSLPVIDAHIEGRPVAKPKCSTIEARAVVDGGAGPANFLYITVLSGCRDNKTSTVLLKQQ